MSSRPRRPRPPRTVTRAGASTEPRPATLLEFRTLLEGVAWAAFEAGSTVESEYARLLADGLEAKVAEVVEFLIEWGLVG